MIIYGDVLIVENMIVGGVLIYITAELQRMNVTKRFFACRFTAGCMMCGLFSLTVFLTAGFFVKLILEAAFALLVCCVVFGRHRLIAVSATFILVTYFMGGFIMGLMLLTDHSGIYTGTGIYTGDMKAGSLALFTAFFVMTAKHIVIAIRRRKFNDEHIFDVEIYVGELCVKTTGFIDTGNQLRDPVSRNPAAIADEILWQQMCEKGMIRDERSCVLFYETVDGRGMLEGIRCDHVRLYTTSQEDGHESGCPGRFAAEVKGCVIAYKKGSFCFDRDYGGVRCRLLMPVYLKKEIS